MSNQVRASIENPHLEFVIPVYNEGDLIESFINSLVEKIKVYTTKYRLVLVDDGSTDQSASIIQKLAKKHTITLVSFSRNFGKEPAITAGLKEASLDANAVIIMDSDSQHPLSVIDQFIEKWYAGYDNVYGVRSRGDQPFLKRFFSRWFYKLNKIIMNIELPPDAGDFRLIDRQVLKALNALPETNRFMKGLYAWVGFSGYAIPYDVQPRKGDGKSKWNYRKLFELALTGITSFSDWPLRIWSLVGFFISLLAFCYGIFVIISTLVEGAQTPGWATVVAGISFLGGIQLISIGVIGEYVARIFNEVKQRPIYIINQTKSQNLKSNEKNSD
ncbi:glycosyltransferase family 2 protein [Thiotrichales bacterium 19S9-12]|nr:glycosyltransferase family 2 protein [Thiotrichales bacterium 19S9-11]MCF6812361.1 glycosyltransferase family 2 protein [Thiotrichales bacterium 19S9-12]